MSHAGSLWSKMNDKPFIQMSSFCVTTAAKSVHSLRNILEELHLNDPTRRLKFLKDENLVAIPVKCTNSEAVFSAEELKEKIGSHKKFNFAQSTFHIRTLELPVAKKLSVKTPSQVLKNDLKTLLKRYDYQWTDEVEKDIPSHWERHGDLVLVPGTSFSLPVWTDIGTEVWLTVTKCLSCSRLARKCPVSVDQYRTPQVTMLYGSDTWVEHIDNGIKYTYDITRCMFSAGNITEKLRVAGFRCDGEVVVDLYAGIGYFTLPYLVYTGVKHLHACEWNPYAVEALHRNLVLNRVEDRCTVHEGDNRKVCPRGVADRVNLGLIPSSHEGWLVACEALNPTSGGILHIHCNVNTKPRDGKDVKSDEPGQPFRCEAKTELPKDTHMGEQQVKTVFNLDVISSQSQCIDSKSEGIKNYGKAKIASDSTDIVSSLVDTENQVEHDDIEASDRNNKSCNKLENDVRDSKWYSWAEETASEIRDMLQSLHQNVWDTSVLHIEHVKSYAPYVDHIVLDLLCKPCS